MKINVKDFTSAFNKVADITTGDKQVPGVLLSLYKTEGETDTKGKLDICYSDSHKSIIETINVEIEETDMIGKIALSFEKLKEAVAKCQPSGSIKTDDLSVAYLENNVIRMSVTQYQEIVDADGNIVGNRQLGVVNSDLHWEEPGSNIRTSVLTRANYDSIFEPEGVPDEYSKQEFVEALSKTAVEKGRNIYFSQGTQSVFVANQAHVTAVPISGFDTPSQEEQDEFRGSLPEGMSPEEKNEKFNEWLDAKVNRIHYSIIIPQNIAKSVISIVNRCNAEKIEVHRKDGRYCNIIIGDGEEERVGIWFEMAAKNNAHLGALDRYNSMEFKTYQVLFNRELLAHHVKSAVGTVKADRTAISFEPTTLENPVCPLDLVISSASSSASVQDKYSANPDDYIDTVGDLEGKKFTISLKVFDDMLSQIKTDLVAFDFNVDTATGVTCVRLAEVDTKAMSDEYVSARQQTEELCRQQGIEFDPNSTPTPVELKLNYRLKTLKTKQYTVLANK